MLVNATNRTYLRKVKIMVKLPDHEHLLRRCMQLDTESKLLQVHVTEAKQTGLADDSAPVVPYNGVPCVWVKADFSIVVTPNQHKYFKAKNEPLGEIAEWLKVEG